MRLHSRLAVAMPQVKVMKMDHALGLGKMPEIAACVCRDFPHNLDSVIWIPKQRGETLGWGSPGFITEMGPEHGVPLHWRLCDKGT